MGSPPAPTSPISRALRSEAGSPGSFHFVLCSDSTTLLLTSLYSGLHASLGSAAPLLLLPQAPTATPVALPWKLISHHACAPATLLAQNVLHDFRARSVGSGSSFFISLPTL